jgi:myo-inositol 2-dehydrogenase/D-chiro-inositol 1-dehydrogenase
MTETVRFGLIGCGDHGRRLTQALSIVPGARLVACTDANPAALASFPGEDLERYGSSAEMLARAQLDAVIVVTAHPALAATATAVLDSGRHVFCEKPMALNAAQGRPVVEAARRNGRNLMVGYCLRYDPLRVWTKQLIDRGAVGDIVYVNAGKGGPALTGWLADRAQGGGELLWLGSHLVDQVNWLVGRRAERVYAEMVRQPDGITDQTSIFTIRYAGGLLAHLNCSQAEHAGSDYVEIVGSRGRIHTAWVPQMVMTVHSDMIPEYREPTVIRPLDTNWLRMYTEELREFVASIQEGRQPAVTGEDGLRALEILDAVDESAERNAPIPIL